MDNYFDIRFLLLPLVNYLTSAAHAGGSDSAGFAMNEVKLVLMFVALLSFLLTTIRLPLVFCWPFHFERWFQLRLGRSGFSVPVTLSLTATLFLPPSAFWKAYLFIMIMSFWSDTIHSLVTRFSYTEEHFWMLPVSHVNTLQLHTSSNEQGTNQTTLE